MRNRSYRRWRQDLATDHAFNIRFYQWDLKNHWQSSWFYSNYEKLIGADKHQAQDENRLEVFAIAKKAANNLRRCSCLLCKRYGRSGLSPRILRQEEEMKVDMLDLQEYLYES